MEALHVFPHIGALGVEVRDVLEVEIRFAAHAAGVFVGYYGGVEEFAEGLGGGEGVC